jgi:hypothetical protein
VFIPITQYMVTALPIARRGGTTLGQYTTCGGERWGCVNSRYTIADALVTNFFCRFGVLRQLHSDQGRNIESRLMQEMLESLGTGKTRTTPLHPQSDDMVERFVKTVEEHLRKVGSTHYIGTRGYPSSCWPPQHKTMRPQPRRPSAWCSGASYVCHVTFCSGLPPTRNSLRPTRPAA